MTNDTQRRLVEACGDLDKAIALLEVARDIFQKRGSTTCRIATEKLIREARDD